MSACLQSMNSFHFDTKCMALNGCHVRAAMTSM
jgi:hypothetical protein